jgi:hydroxyethylthiazole kinase
MTDGPGHQLAQMREAAPLVQNITNFVAMNVMANVLLAIGASPAMVHARAEAAEFAGIAQALSVNIGTADPEWGASMIDAAQAMGAQGKPWVLDPVAVGATGFRRDLGVRLLACAPTVIRGNASEILALSGGDGSGRGVDSSDPVALAEAGARELAQSSGAVVAVTGPIDFVTDGTRAARIANGHEMMPRVTALGCSLTGVVAAFCVVAAPFEATVSALATFGVAGDQAARQAAGPGSFAMGLIDALHGLTPRMLDSQARITPA